MADILAFIQSYPTVWSAIKLVLTALLAFIVVYAVLRLEKKVSKKLIAKRNNINLRFVENIVRFIVIFLAVQWVVMSSDLTEPFGRVLFQGTTVIAAIAGFAAQPVIADMICGLMLSVTKPFDIGDRIELEDGRAGIVKDITLRHVTLQEIDTLLLVIPNSKLNGMKITNMSQLRPKRSVHFRFHVAYNADVDRAMAVIADAVRQSPYTVPQTTDGQYAPVYFISYGESSLVMATTVYYEPTSRTEVMKSDVNLRVRHALNEAGIEIPYNYVNVVMHEAK